MSIEKQVQGLLRELGQDIHLVVAAKNRTPAEVMECIHAGARIIGENYLQDAERAYQVIGTGPILHFIGRLQRKKIKKIVQLFDMVQTLDNLEMASLINRECLSLDKTMPVLVEVNSGKEVQKTGVMPEEAEGFIKQVSDFEHLKVMGLMTMGPLLADPEEYRPYFRLTRQIFEKIRALRMKGVQMDYLSMGMTDSYRVAIEEGANMVRIGSKIFGPRV